MAQASAPLPDYPPSNAPATDPAPKPKDKKARKGMADPDVVAYYDQVEAEKRAALVDPGPSWKEWFYFSALKTWIFVALLIVDVWVVVTFLEAALWTALIASVIVMAYVEFLLWQYLWHRPDAEIRRGRHGTFHATWYRPVHYGRWTPEGTAARSGQALPETGGPDSREFL